MYLWEWAEGIDYGNSQEQMRWSFCLWTYSLLEKQMISEISFDNWTQNSQCSVHSHYTINIADSSLKQNACHVLVWT